MGEKGEEKLGALEEMFESETKWKEAARRGQKGGKEKEGRWKLLE